MLALTATLTACSTDYTQNQNNIKNIIVKNNVERIGPMPSALNNLAPAAGTASTGFQPAYKSDSAQGHCRLKDRFDRKELIAYNFSDGKTRVGLKMDMDGFSLSDAGNFDVEEIKLNFRYRFQPIKKRKEKCLYESSWQGLFGSGYNEFYLREEQTVYEELDDEIDRVQDELQKYF